MCVSVSLFIFPETIVQSSPAELQIKERVLERETVRSAEKKKNCLKTI